MTATASCSSAGNRLGRNGVNNIVFIGSQVTGSECVLFIGSQPAWTEQPKRGPIHRLGVWHTAKRRKWPSVRAPMIETGSYSLAGVLAYRKTEETYFCSSAYGRNGVLLIGRALAYSKTEETDFSPTAYGRNGGHVHREGCGVPQNGTPRATVHPWSTSLQPPPSTVHPPSTSSSFHRLLFIQPPWGPVHPPPTGWPPRGPVHPAPTTFTWPGYCSSIANQPAGVGCTSGRQQRELFIHSQPTS